MRQSIRCRIVPISLWLAGISCLPLAGIGCSSNSKPAPDLVIRSDREHQTFSQPFVAAYASQSGGDTSIVVVDRAAQLAMEDHTGSAPVRQVMSIRVMWNPTRDSKWDHNSASNATVHWYVIGNTPQTAGEVIEYSGTALVMVDHDQSGTDLEIRGAWVRPVAWRGSLHDPIGASELHGTLHADNSPQRVRQILSAVRTVVAAANALPSNPTVRVKPESPSTLARQEPGAAQPPSQNVSQ